MRRALSFLPGIACIAFLALAAMPAAAQQVGVAAAVNPAAQGTPPGGKVRTLSIGESVVHNERINTDTRGLLQVLLADGTSFTVGPNSNLTIDSFVYDPDKGTAKITASLTKGVFRFIGGRTSKTPGGVQLNTPVGTVGIRGGIANIVLNPEAGIPRHIDLIFGDSIQLWRQNLRAARLYARGYSIYFDADGDPHVRRTPKEWLKVLQGLLSGKSGQHGGASHLPSNSIIEQSNLPQSNAGQPPSYGNFPTPGASPDDPVQQQGGGDHNHNSLSEPCWDCCYYCD